MNLREVLLRGAAVLVPATRRAEWLAEWRAELFYVNRNRTAFCLGAFRDAFWLWRNDSSPDCNSRLIETPGRCLLLLAAVGLLCLAFALVLPAGRTILLRATFPVTPALRLIAGLLFSGLIVPRRLLFAAVKTLLFLPIVGFGSIALASLGFSGSSLALDIALFACIVAGRWILADQRKRCPVCLRLLTNPVRIGESSHILLEWHGTEMMCPRGHGLLYSPEWPGIWSRRQRWMGLGASWGSLFR